MEVKKYGNLDLEEKKIGFEPDAPTDLRMSHLGRFVYEISRLGLSCSQSRHHIVDARVHGLYLRVHVVDLIEK